MTTPDRFPGTRQEDEIKMETNESPEGGLGSISFNGATFVLQDDVGSFNPRESSPFSATQRGQVAYSTDGLTVTMRLPLTSWANGWLMNNEGELLVVGW